MKITTDISGMWSKLMLMFTCLNIIMLQSDSGDHPTDRRCRANTKINQEAVIIFGADVTRLNSET